MNRFRRTILTTTRRSPLKFPSWSKPKARKSACALRPSPICKAPLSSGISTVIPNCCRMATPEARLPQLQSSNRYGFEVGNYYTPQEHLVFDADFADSRALFTQNDPDDSTFYTTNTPTGAMQLCPRNSNCYGLVPIGGGAYLQNHYGKLVPEAVRWVVSAGATLHEYQGFSASLRLRYFGPRDLTSDGLYTSPSTCLVNLGARYEFNKHWSVLGEVLNLLNRRDHDVDYAYVSQITPAAGLGLPATPPTTLAGQELVASVMNANAAFTRVMHPVEPVQARFGLVYSFGK